MSEGPFSKDPLTNITLSPHEFVTKESVHRNVRQNIIITTEDKVRLCMRDAVDRMKKRGDWQGPLGLFFGLVSTILVSDFKPMFTVTADTWKGIFIILTVISGSWFVVTVFRALWTSWKTGFKSDVEQVIEQMKLPSTDLHQVGADGTSVVKAHESEHTQKSA